MKLEYTFKHDTLFKMLFTRYPDLLKRLVAGLLHIRFESIEQFDITNPEIPPENAEEKFCRLDINMLVDGQRVDLEIQVANEGDYPERSLYYWAREYSGALAYGEDYRDLPRTIIISIVAFKLFDCMAFHSEFQALEITQHTPLTDKMSLRYFELLKLPAAIDIHDESELWLRLFKAETEEDLQQIEALGVPIMEQAIKAYRHISATDELKEIERLRSLARHNEAAALRCAREEEREKWQPLVTAQAAALVEKDTALVEKDTALAEKDTALAAQAAEIAKLRARLAQFEQ